MMPTAFFQQTLAVCLERVMMTNIRRPSCNIVCYFELCLTYVAVRGLGLTSARGVYMVCLRVVLADTHTHE